MNIGDYLTLLVATVFLEEVALFVFFYSYRRLYLIVLFVNCITHSLLFIFFALAVNFFGYLPAWILIGGECVVFIGEALLYRFSAGRSLSLARCVMISIVLNGCSFLFGEVFLWLH